MHDEKNREMNNRKISRRDFVGMTVAAGVVAGAKGSLADLACAVDSKTGMQYRTLGNTGEKVSMMGLGGFHIGTQKEEREESEGAEGAEENGGS